MKDLLDTQLQDSSAPTRDIIAAAAEKNNIHPSLLASSINVNPDEYSGDETHPVSGYSHYGITGDIPQDIPHSPVSGVVNGQTVKSANFPTHEDALNAKAALLRSSLDNIKSQAEKRGTPISDQVAEFIHHAGDNGIKMLKGYADNGTLNDNILSKKPEGFGAVYNKAKEGYDNARGFDPEFPNSNQPEITNQHRQDWNDYIDWLDKKGMRGSPELDKGGKGFQMIEEYRKENPNTTVSKEMITPLQKDFSKYRQYALDQIKSGKGEFEKGGNEENFMKQLSIVDGIPGQRTTGFKFPTAYMQVKLPNGKKAFVQQKMDSNSVGGVTLDPKFATAVR